jgi:hypothetical protein
VCFVVFFSPPRGGGGGGRERERSVPKVNALCVLHSVAVSTSLTLSI